MLSETKNTIQSPQPDLKRGVSAESRVDSATLLGSAKVVWIHHRGEMYALRETRNGKLILTK